MKKLFSQDPTVEKAKLEKRIEKAKELLGRFSNLHYIRPNKSGFKLASRYVEELTLGDKCSDCTSASISGFNFWTVPTWLTDPTFNFLLQHRFSYLKTTPKKIKSYSLFSLVGFSRYHNLSPLGDSN